MYANRLQAYEFNLKLITVSVLLCFYGNKLLIIKVVIK